MTRPRVVLDTNCLVSALLFKGGLLAWMRTGWQEGRFVPLACRETAAELIRVLAYAKFGLDAGDIEALLADFLPYAETATLPRRLKPFPGLRDPEDAVFLHLAKRAKADWLVTGDGHLHEMKDKIAGIQIANPAEFRREIYGHEPPGEGD